MSSRLSSFAFASASGVLLALSFPRFGHPAVAWIALAPLLVALPGATLGRAFAMGLLTGVFYFTGTLYWITRVMVVYGDLAPWVGVIINTLLILYQGAFPALFALIVCRLVMIHGRPALLAAPAGWV